MSAVTYLVDEACRSVAESGSRSLNETFSLSQKHVGVAEHGEVVELQTFLFPFSEEVVLFSRWILEETRDFHEVCRGTFRTHIVLIYVSPINFLSVHYFFLAET